MRLHKFHVDYRDEHSDKEIIVYERQLFTEDIKNSEATVMVVGNDVRASKSISNIERVERLTRIKTREDLRISLIDHDIHIPRKDERDID